ncbi:MAG: hypothetical protein U0X92_09540 [Anaerolineales bacterium]
MARHLALPFHPLRRLRVVRRIHHQSDQSAASDLHRDSSAFTIADCDSVSHLDSHFDIHYNANSGGDVNPVSNAEPNCLAHFDIYPIFDFLLHANEHLDSNIHAHPLSNCNAQTF